MDSLFRRLECRNLHALAEIRSFRRFRLSHIGVLLVTIRHHGVAVPVHFPQSVQPELVVMAPSSVLVPGSKARSP